MASNVILDSSVWVAYIDKADSQHADAVAIFTPDAVKVVPDFIVSEVATVLKGKKTFGNVESFLDIVLDNEDTEIMYTQNRFLDFVNVFKKSSMNKLSFVDASLLSLASQFTILTFDKELGRVITKQRRKKK